MPTSGTARCLGYLWNHDLSAKPSIEYNIMKARKSFFAYRSMGVFQGDLSPLPGRSVVETCILPILLYGAENWCLSQNSIQALDSFLGELYSSHFRISRVVQQGSILSPTFFLVVMDKLLFELNEKKAGIFIYDLYLGGSAHADDVRSISTSANTAKEQSLLISDFASNNGLTLNMSKTEVVKISRNPTLNNETVNL